LSQWGHVFIDVEIVRNPAPWTPSLGLNGATSSSTWKSNRNRGRRETAEGEIDHDESQWGHVFIDVEIRPLGSRWANRIASQWGHVFIDVEMASVQMPMAKGLPARFASGSGCGHRRSGVNPDSVVKDRLNGGFKARERCPGQRHHLTARTCFNRFTLSTVSHHKR